MNKKLFMKGFLAAILSIAFATIFGSSASYAEAVITRGLFTDSNDVRWEWQKTIDDENTTESEMVSIMFYDKPAATTEIVVPSLSDVITAANATSTLNTYYVRNADEEAQATNFPSETKRQSTADVTKLDMTNTSKVQIMGIRPILNPDVEAELIFGEHMVIGDNIAITKSITISVCKTFGSDYMYYVGLRHYCEEYEDEELYNLERLVSNWDDLTVEEQRGLDIEPYLDILGYTRMRSRVLVDDEYDPARIYYSDPVEKRTDIGNGVFGGYKLKLTNFGNFNYVGWFAFKDSTFNQDSTTITIDTDTFLGEDIFTGTNVERAIIKSNNTGVGLFRGCPNLSEIVFDESVNTVGYANFANTNLGTFDFSATNIKTIGDHAFENAGLTAINLEGVEAIEYQAFKDNGLTEIYLPKSINRLGAAIFAKNTSLKKATIAYDTLTSGTMLQFATVLDGVPYPWGNETGIYNTNSTNVQDILEELIVLAPYGEGEEVKPTHLNYFEYRDAPDAPYYSTTMNTPYFNGTDYSPIKAMENLYPELAGFKNVVAPLYFAFLDGLKSITIGDGFEYIGNAALISNYSNGTYALARGCYSTCRKNSTLETVVLPEILKGIGSLALQNIYNENFTISDLPGGLEFIGIAAFSEVYFLEGDFDLPNLRFLGDYAFYSTQIHDVYLHDKIEYIGVGVFNDCPALHDITFDYDVFNPDAHNWWLYGSSGYRNYQLLFGANIGYNSSIMAQLGYTMADTNNGDVKYGTITFTEKAVHPIPSLCDISYATCNRDNNFYSGHTQTFFGGIAAEKIDLSKTPWERIPEVAFERISVNEFLLPEGLKEVSAGLFMNAHIEEEMVLPEGLEVIGFKSFIQHCSSYNVVCADHEITITKLPDSIKEIKELAFYNDKNFTADIDLPNLEILGGQAFLGTTVKNVALRDKLQTIGNGPFWGVPTIENITIDTDLFAGDKYRYYSGAECNTPYRNQYKMGCYFENSGRLKADREGYDFVYDTITFTDKVRTLPADSIYFMGLFNVNTLDMSAAKFTTIPRSAFVQTNINQILFPAELEIIDRESFMLANISEEVVLPDTVRTIEARAFNNYCWSSYPYCYDGVTITKLPTSLEIVGEGAFFKDRNFTADVDLPNLRRIGQSAFAETRLRNVTLHDSITEPVFSGAFAFITTLENVVIDYDFYGYNNSSVDFEYYANRERQECEATQPQGTYCSTSWPYTYISFWSIFSTDSYEAGWSWLWDDDAEKMRPYASVTFTEKAVTAPTALQNYYDNARLRFEKLDLSRTGWTHFDDTYFFQGAEIGELLLPEGLETINIGAFYGATIEEPVTLPATLKTIGDYAFQEAKVTFANTFAEGLETIGKGAFYGATISGDMTIPSTVTSIGWSAFNAGDADVNYGTVTIKPALNYDSTDSQAVFQLFWNAKMDKLVIESPMLPVLGALQAEPVLPHEVQYEVVTNEGTETVTVTPTLRADGEPEFHAMTMKEVEIKNLPTITANAFEECTNLEQVSFANHTNLQEIGKYAFNNDTKLKTFTFGEGLTGKNVALKEYAFNNTAIETIGDQNSDFALTAANFNAVEPHVFSNMPNLKSVSVPGTFSIDATLANAELYTNGSTIPAYTFANDPELETVVVNYELSAIKEDAFANDTKLAKIFLWGNTDIEENGTGLTIPEQTTIFAYSDAPAEAYANAASRDSYDGKFYALDEVLYLTTNRTYVVLNDDKDDFDKDGLKLYALRRDGVILESDNWQEYTTAFPRSTTNINFEEGRGALGDDSASIAAVVYDAPKPFNTISLANQNYANVDFEFVTMPSSDNPLVLIHYPDGYTSNIRTATLASMTKAEEEEYLRRLEEELNVPNTGVFLEVMKVATPAVSLSAIIIAGALMITRKRR